MDDLHDEGRAGPGAEVAHLVLEGVVEGDASGVAEGPPAGGGAEERAVGDGDAVVEHQLPVARPRVRATDD